MDAFWKKRQGSFLWDRFGWGQKTSTDSQSILVLPAISIHIYSLVSFTIHLVNLEVFALASFFSIWKIPEDHSTDLAGDFTHLLDILGLAPSTCVAGCPVLLGRRTQSLRVNRAGKPGKPGKTAAFSDQKHCKSLMAISWGEEGSVFFTFVLLRSQVFHAWEWFPICSWVWCMVLDSGDGEQHSNMFTCCQRQWLTCYCGWSTRSTRSTRPHEALHMDKRLGHSLGSLCRLQSSGVCCREVVVWFKT